MPSWATAAWEDFLIVHGRLSPTRPPRIPAWERTSHEPATRPPCHALGQALHRPPGICQGGHPPLRGIHSKEGKVLIPIQCSHLPKEKAMKHLWGRLSCSLMNPLPPPSLLRRSGYEGRTRCRVDAPERFNAQARRQVSPRGRGEMD